MTLKVGISGIRGIVGISLTEEITSDFCRAAGTYFNGKRIVIGTDARQSKDIIKKAAIAGLKSCGCSVIDIGICPTPTVQLIVKKLKASGGIVVTASHNPPKWNGLKIIRGDGIFLNDGQATKLIGIYESKNFRRARIKSKPVKKYPAALDTHINLVLKNVNVKKIKSKKFKVAVDCCNGAGAIILPKLLKKLGCKVFKINSSQGKTVPRELEPTAENITALCRAVKKYKCDIGFAQDPDADRLSIVENNGRALGEEYSVVLAAEFVLSQNGPTNVVVNLSTSSMIDDTAKKYGASVVRTKIGEVNVSEKMKELKSIIGGEGNGGVIFPVVGLGRDSLAGVAIILNLLTERGRTLSEIVSTIPKYIILKDKIQGSVDDLVSKLKSKFINCEMDFQDGVKIIYPDKWVHARPSNTEPIIRIIAEGKTIEESKDLIEQVKSALLPSG